MMPMGAGPLWTAEEAAAATGGRLEGGEGWTATGVSIDTRTLERGELFVALSDQRDGHDFAQAAIDRGASAALVSKADACAGPRLVVGNVQDALEKLGLAARRRSDAIRVGVTGSVGKTSVKDTIASAFAAAGPAHFSVKSYNNHWGVPLTLARMPANTRHAVFEMGMNHAGEIRELSAQVKPHVALITRIAPAHLEMLGSVEAIADAKAEIFEGLAQDGVAVIPGDDPLAGRLNAAAETSRAAFILEFGTQPGAAVRVLDYTDGPDGGVGRFEVLGKTISVRIGAPGAHQAMNGAAVMAACVAAGLEPGQVADTLAELSLQPGRGARFEAALPDGGRVTVIDDSYNANPVSMASAIAGLKARAGGRKVAVLGEMLELGPDAPTLHAGLAASLKEAGVAEVIGVGALTRHLTEALPGSVAGHHAKDAETALDLLAERLRDGDVVLIKGSNASGVHKVAASLREGARRVPAEG